LYPPSQASDFAVANGLAVFSRRRKAAIATPESAKSFGRSKAAATSNCGVRRKSLRIRRVSGFDPHRPYQRIQNLILLQIGSIGSNIGPKQSHFCRYLLTKLRSYVRVARCWPGGAERRDRFDAGWVWSGAAVCRIRNAGASALNQLPIPCGLRGADQRVLAIRQTSRIA